jgi:platelet-activating factor acetylhydrolase
MFGSSIYLNYESIFAMGHSFGGVTSVCFGYEDDRIKAIIALDPWLFPLDNDVIKTMNTNKPVMFINTETFGKTHRDTNLKEKNQLFY